MREAFKQHDPEVWDAAERAHKAATTDSSGLYMPLDLYNAIPSNSVDYAIIEKLGGIAMVKSRSFPMRKTG